MTIEQRVAVLEEIFSKLNDYYTSAYSGEEIDARLASAGVPIGITKEYKSVAEMNQDFTGTDVQRGQFVLILPDSTSSADYGKVYLKGTANWVYAFTLTTLTSIKGPPGPPGKKGDKGDPGEAGSSFVILGYFDTLDALKAAVPNPKAGDVYGVGTAPPYNIYIWDSVHSKWVGNGNLQGPEGPVGGSGNFVRYDAAQSLSDAQKAQARGNIGAMQGIESADHPGCYYVLNGSAVEWVNPPMELGTEYRTTERYMGKPVYKKLVTTGALPSATGVVEYFPFGTDYNAGEYTVFSSEYHIANNSNDGGWTITIPKFSNGSLDVSMGFSGRRIDIYVNSDKSSYYGFALLKYTKTTD